MAPSVTGLPALDRIWLLLQHRRYELAAAAARQRIAPLPMPCACANGSTKPVLLPLRP
jgi:hypothetical protein